MVLCTMDSPVSCVVCQVRVAYREKVLEMYEGYYGG